MIKLPLVLLVLLVGNKASDYEANHHQTAHGNHNKDNGTQATAWALKASKQSKIFLYKTLLLHDLILVTFNAVIIQVLIDINFNVEYHYIYIYDKVVCTYYSK